MTKLSYNGAHLFALPDEPVRRDNILTFKDNLRDCRVPSSAELAATRIEIQHGPGDKAAKEALKLIN